RPEDPGPLVAAAEQLAAGLAGSREVASARCGMTPEDERFFLHSVAPRAPLLRQTLSSPAGGFASPFMTADPLGFSEELLTQVAADLPVDPLSGAFLSRDGRAVLLIVTPSRSELDPAGGRALLADLHRAFAPVERSSPIPLRMLAVGGPIYAAHDEGIVRED